VRPFTDISLDPLRCHFHPKRQTPKRCERNPRSISFRHEPEAGAYPTGKNGSR
jgi:hypothetical protein